MKKIGLFMGVLLLLIILAGTAGCMGIFDDFSLAASTDEILQMQTQTPTQMQTQTPTPEWIQWNVDDTGIDLGKGGYSMFWPNLDFIMFKDLKIEIDMDDNAQVDLRIVTDEELQEYQKNWETSTSSDRDAIGIFIGGVSQLTEEYHSDEGMALILEPTDDQPGTGTIKIYYLK